VSAWEIDRHAVAISGNVADGQTSRAIGGARVEITAAPAAFSDRLALHAMQYGSRWAALKERPDRTYTAVDGHFHFMDLPDGDYTLTVTLSGSGSRYGVAQVTATVSRDAGGNILMATANTSLAPTTLKGQITSADSGAAVVMAEVCVEGSGERMFSGPNGAYILTGLEAGRRTVSVSAQGYESVTWQVDVGPAGAVQTLDFALLLAGTAGFDPTSISGCRLWLQAEAIVGLSDGAPVLTWSDESGSDHHAAQTQASRQPEFRTNVINSRPVVRFDGADSMSLSLSEASTEHTFFFVIDLTALGGHHNFLFDSQAGRLVLDAAKSDAPYYVRWRDSTWRDVAGSVAGRQIVAWVFSGTTGEVFRNGVGLGSETYNPTSLGGITALGSNYGGNQSRFAGDVAEVIYYNRALSPADRQQVEQYLSNRYAIPLS
jgi:hypothetical protein